MITPIILSFLILAGVSYGAPVRKKTECTLVISELLGRSENVPTDSPFIELEKLCPAGSSLKSGSLNHYVLVMIDVKSEAITLFCKLEGMLTEVKHENKRHFFYVLGEKSFSNEGVNGPHCTKASGYIPIPDGRKSNVLAVLLHNQRAPFFDALRPKPNLQETLPLKLDSYYYSKFAQPHMKDFLFYGETVPEALPPLFAKIGLPCVDVSTCFLERSFEDNKNKGKGLSRCTTSTSAMLPSAFYLAEKTPGFVNSCGNKVALRNNQHLQSVPNVPEEGLQSRVSLEGVYPDDSECESTTVSTTPVPFKHVWEDCGRFPASVVTEIQAYQSGLIDVDVVKSVPICSWFLYLKNEVDPAKSRFRCRFCHTVLNEEIVTLRPNSKYRTLITQDAGSLSSRKIENSRTLKDHATENEVHAIAVQYFQALDEKKEGQALKDAMRSTEGKLIKFYNATMNVFTIAYKAVHMRIPFNSFPTLVELFKHHGVAVGTHHHTREGMKTIITSMADSMKTQSLDYIQANDLDVALMLDGSVDVANYDVLNIDLHFVDKNLKVQTMFYGLLRLGVDQGAIDIFKLLKERFEQDGSYEYLSKHIVGVITDGASVMRFGLKTQLSDWATHKLLGIHCASHCFELTLKNALKDFKLVKKLDEFFNELYTFYRKSSKVMSHLRDLQDIEKEHFSLHIIKNIRWVASRLRVLKPVLKYWRVLEVQLVELFCDDRFSPQQQEKAAGLHDDLVNRSLILHVAYFADVSRSFTTVSLFSQRSGVTLINLHTLQQQLSNDIVGLESLMGDSLSELLSHSLCGDTDMHQCSVQEFESAQNVRLHGVSLGKPIESNEERLSIQVSKYTSSITTQIKIYFDDEKYPIRMSDVDIFHPKSFPKFGEWDPQMNHKLGRLNAFFEWIPEQQQQRLFGDYEKLVESCVTHPSFAIQLSKPLEEFWNFYCNAEGIEWTPLTLKVVRNLLGLPLSNAASERTFSSLNREKTKQRYNLDVATVESLLRIHDNKVDIAKFDSLFYTKKFAKTHALCDDAAFKDPQGPKPQPLNHDVFTTGDF